MERDAGTQGYSGNRKGLRHTGLFRQSKGIEPSVDAKAAMERDAGTQGYSGNRKGLSLQSMQRQQWKEMQAHRVIQAIERD